MTNDNTQFAELMAGIGKEHDLLVAEVARLEQEIARLKAERDAARREALVEAAKLLEDNRNATFTTMDYAHELRLMADACQPAAEAKPPAVDRYKCEHQGGAGGTRPCPFGCNDGIDKAAPAVDVEGLAKHLRQRFGATFWRWEKLAADVVKYIQQHGGAK